MRILTHRHCSCCIFWKMTGRAEQQRSRSPLQRRRGGGYGGGGGKGGKGGGKGGMGGGKGGKGGGYKGGKDKGGKGWKRGDGKGWKGGGGGGGKGGKGGGGGGKGGNGGGGKGGKGGAGIGMTVVRSARPIASLSKSYAFVAQAKPKRKPIAPKMRPRSALARAAIAASAKRMADKAASMEPRPSCAPVSMPVADDQPKPSSSVGVQRVQV